MQLSTFVHRYGVRLLVVVLLFAGFGGMTGCKTVDVDRGGGHPDFHDDHHDFHDDHRDHY